MLPDTGALGTARGTVHKLGTTDLIAMYHPAFLLRTPSRKGQSWHDMQVLVHRLIAHGILPRLPEPWWTPT
jgi:uracil-DNA glycosylase